jgi:hypothetical protein
MERAQDFVILRACDIAIQHGYNWLIITGKDASYDTRYFTTPITASTTGTITAFGNINTNTQIHGGETYTINRPQVDITIVGYVNQPDVPALDVQLIAKQLREKYELTESDTPTIVSAKSSYSQTISDNTSSEVPLPIQSSFIVGKIRLNVQNDIVKYGIDLDGSHTAGIVLTIQNVNTKEKIELKANNLGYFQEKIPVGDYVLNKFYIKVNGIRDSWRSNWSTPAYGCMYFTIKDDCINNLGFIDWEVNNNKSTYRLNVLSLYSEIQNYMVENNLNSPIGSEEWNNIEIHE